MVLFVLLGGYPPFEGTTRQELLTAMYSHRTVIKVAFRYYALAGVRDPTCCQLEQWPW